MYAGVGFCVQLPAAQHSFIICQVGGLGFSVHATYWQWFYHISESIILRYMWYRNFFVISSKIFIQKQQISYDHSEINFSWLQ